MGLYRRGDSDLWWMSFTYNGRLCRKSTGTSDEKLAKKIFGKVQTQVIEGKWFDIDDSKQRTLKEMIERYKNEYTIHRTYYPQKREKSIFKRLYAFFGKSCILGEIEQRNGSYEQYRKVKGVSPATIVKELGVLRTIFNIARKQWRWKVDNPVSDIKLPKVRNERALSIRG